MQEGEESSDWTEEEAIADQSDDEPEESDRVYDDESSIRSVSRKRRKSSGYSRRSVEDPLLRHRNSTATENQWGEFEVHYLAREQYGHSISTVFGMTEKDVFKDTDEEDDPVISTLHLLDYRYMRFCFHPLKDRFVLCSSWKDPSWTNVKSIRAGLDSDERYRREQVFGKNQISIKQKTIPQLLVDETMKKLREISHFECDLLLMMIRATGAEYRASSWRCDCIVNESMLTGSAPIDRHKILADATIGESVPVSKIPATNQSLHLLDLGSSSVHPEAARNFLFSGTRIIRARRPQDGTDEEAVALAIVARTGVNVGGKIDVICFDKTGTLTEDGLDVLGIRVIQRPAMRFSELLSSSSALLPGAAYERDPTVDYGAHKAALYAMASCHSLRNVDGDLVGDPLDLKMFEFTNWTFTEGSHDPFSQRVDELKPRDCSNAKPPAGFEFEPDDLDEPENNIPIQLNIIKGFEFVSQLRRASVIVSQAGNEYANIYVKGAPECMRDICRPDSFPADYEDLLGFYTHRGFRVIACATKKVPYDWTSLQKLDRKTAECDLDLIGFIVFENKLKAATVETIEKLERAAIRQVMCTGDNILTAISVARECSLIDRTAHCFVPHVAEGSLQDPNAHLVWQSVDNPLFTLDEKTLTPLPPPAESDASLPYDMSNLRNYSLAITGDVFRWIVDFGDEPILQRMLVAAQVFARMSPDEKHELVEKLQTIEYCCGFCGDGANDCGALKAADVGISLSEAEASVAAPFTSRVFNISCVPEVIRQIYSCNVNLISVPFVVTIVVALLFCSYMLFDPATWLVSSMQLTYMTAQFKVFILVLAIGGFACAWVAERKVFLLLARMAGKTHDLIWPHRRKKRKLYKTLLDGMHWALDGGFLPERIIRYGIRTQLQARIRSIASTSLEDGYRSKMQYVEALRTRPMAIETATANAQHYEVGTGVLQACLGPRMKYSCCLYPTGSETLGQAEIEMLDSYVEKAELKDGMTILDLGCGWGSGALYFAEIFPHSQITAFSNSRSQKKHIEQQAFSKGLGNLKVITGDIVDYEFKPESFDRVVSIELFEHMKNYELLMAKVARSLKAGGKLFVHIFSHDTTPYDFEDGWMSTHFFSGGTMPSADLVHYFQKDLMLTKQWWVSGKHYAKTCEDWLWKLSNSKASVWPHLEDTYGKEQAGTWFQRWKIFYMACAELFAYGGGDTWGVSHYLFVKSTT
ncbi:MAG: hypothetical protein Q9209_002234 [Squamulea sp. 1 TL-2023]